MTNINNKRSYATVVKNNINNPVHSNKNNTVAQFERCQRDVVDNKLNDQQAKEKRVIIEQKIRKQMEQVIKNIPLLKHRKIEWFNGQNHEYDHYRTQLRFRKNDTEYLQFYLDDTTHFIVFTVLEKQFVRDFRTPPLGGFYEFEPIYSKATVNVYQMPNIVADCLKMLDDIHRIKNKYQAEIRIIEKKYQDKQYI